MTYKCVSIDIINFKNYVYIPLFMSITNIIIILIMQYS